MSTVDPAKAPYGEGVVVPESLDDIEKDLDPSSKAYLERIRPNYVTQDDQAEFIKIAQALLVLHDINIGAPILPKPPSGRVLTKEETKSLIQLQQNKAYAVIATFAVKAGQNNPPALSGLLSALKAAGALDENTEQIMQNIINEAQAGLRDPGTVSNSREVNQWFHSSGAVGVAIAMLLLGKMMSNLAQVESRAGVQLRKATREMVMDEMGAIIEGGRQKAKQAKQMAIIGFAEAGLSIGMGILSMSAFGRDRSVQLDMFNRGFTSGMDAGKKLVEANYAVPIAQQEALQTLFKYEADYLGGAASTAMQRGVDLHDQISQLFSKLNDITDTLSRILWTKG